LAVSSSLIHDSSILNELFPFRKLSGNNQKSISVTNRPLPFTVASRVAQLGAGNNLGFNIAFNTGFALAFVSALYVMFYIKERTTKAKLLQYVSGANKVVFWTVSFLLDYVLFIFISLVFIGALLAYQVEGYRTYVEVARIFLVLLLFGAAMLPFTYLASFLFQVPSSGLSVLSIGYIISGVFFYMAYFIFNADGFNLKHIAEVLGWIFLPFPHYNLARSLSNLNIMQTTIRTCDQLCALSPLCTPELLCMAEESCCDREIYSFRAAGIGVHLVTLSAICVIAFGLLFAVEYRVFQNIIYRLKKSKV